MLTLFYFPEPHRPEVAAPTESIFSCVLFVGAATPRRMQAWGLPSNLPQPSQAPDRTASCDPSANAGRRSANNPNLQPSGIPVRIVTNVIYQPGPQWIRDDIACDR